VKGSSSGGFGKGGTRWRSRIGDTNFGKYRGSRETFKHGKRRPRKEVANTLGKEGQRQGL